MKIIKILFVLFGLLLVAGCESGHDNTDQGNNKNEIIKLEKLKKQKRNAADSLRKAIDSLQAKKDSLKKAIENEQN